MSVLSVITLAIELLVKSFIKEFVSDGATELIDIIFIALFSLVFWIDISYNKKIGILSFPLFVGYSFRVFLLFWDVYCKNVYVLPNSGLDSEGFYQRALVVMHSGLLKGKTFPNLMGTIFSIIGSSRLYGQFIVVLFSVVSLTILAIILNELDVSHKAKYTVFSIVSLLPNLAILSSVFLRESVISMCLTISFYFVYKWLNSTRTHNIILAFVFVLFAAMFHSGSIAIAFGYIAIVLLFDKRNKVFKASVKNIIPTVVLLLIMSFLYTNYSDLLFGRMKNIDGLSDIAEETVRGDTSYVQYVGNSDTVFNMLVFTIPRIFFFISSPLPFQWRGISDIIAFCCSSVYYLIIFIYSIHYFRKGANKNKALVVALIIVIFSTFFVFGWGVANAGTACRHRDKIAIICGILLSLVYDPIHQGGNDRKGVSV